MTGRVLGVICLIAAGAMYTAEFVVWKASEHWVLDGSPSVNGFVVLLTILGALFLVGEYAPRVFKSCKRMIDDDYQRSIESSERADAEERTNDR